VVTAGSGPRIGLIGCGAIGRWHARIATEHPVARLVAVCDIDEAGAVAVAEAHGVDAHLDPQRMLAAAQLDAVVIATPEDRHLEHAALCAAAGCAVLIEKPVAPDPAGVEATMKVIADHGVLAMAGHVERFETGSALLQAAVSEGVCGDVVSILARRQFAPTDAARFTGRSSTLRLLAVHDFDLIRWVHPVPVAEVHAAAGRGAVFRNTGLDDHVITTVRFADGAVAMIESAWTLPRPYAEWQAPATWQPSGNNRLEVFGDAGFVSNDMSIRTSQLVAFDRSEGFRAAGTRHQPVVHGRVRGALKAQFDHFVDSVIHRRTPLVTMQDALRAVSLTAAAEESLATGRPVARLAA
jgi:myo-inositol 2-dehydrogenase/D-chiro-inositol 1-dehydrogenase